MTGKSANWQELASDCVCFANSAGGKLLIGIEDDVVTIEDTQGVEHKLPFDAIDTAKLVLTDKLIAATVPLSIEGADEMEEEGQD